MLTIVICTHNSAEPLAHSLTALVPAVVDGLLRRVVVIDSGSQDQTLLVAESMGCAVHPKTEVMEVLESLSTDWLLLLRPGVILPQGWEHIARKHIEESKAPARFSLMREKGAGWLAKVFSSKPGLEAGLMAPTSILKPILKTVPDFKKSPRLLNPQRLPIFVELRTDEKGEA